MTLEKVKEQIMQSHNHYSPHVDEPAFEMCEECLVKNEEIKELKERIEKLEKRSCSDCKHDGENLYCSDCHPDSWSEK